MHFECFCTAQYHAVVCVGYCFRIQIIAKLLAANKYGILFLSATLTVFSAI